MIEIATTLGALVAVILLSKVVAPRAQSGLATQRRLQTLARRSQILAPAGQIMAATMLVAAFLIVLTRGAPVSLLRALLP